jgi:carbon-monoxide dehydrogenase small subunit
MTPIDTETRRITLTVNGRQHTLDVEPRRLLADMIRVDLGLTGLNIGCAHGVCGSCTVLLNGETVRSCILFGVQADGAEITTVEGVAPSYTEMHPVQEAFWEKQGLQCGYCTPGMVLRTIELLRENPKPTREEAREAISSNLCRCTGYQFIVDSVLDAADRMADGGATRPDAQGGDGASPAVQLSQGDDDGESNPAPTGHP